MNVNGLRFLNPKGNSSIKAMLTEQCLEAHADVEGLDQTAHICRLLGYAVRTLA